MVRTKRWKDLIWIGFDTETTGKYPVGSQICEIGAVKWKNGEVIDQFQTLVKPKKPMGSEVIAIHGISNEMVAEAPSIEEVIPCFRSFITDGILVAHHAQFDMGFIAYEFEKNNLELPRVPVVCSSLLSRRVLPQSRNHRLQTLVEYLHLDGGQAHRAFDDAWSCLQVALHCFDKLGPQATLHDIIGKMGAELLWSRFSLIELADRQVGLRLVKAIQAESEVQLVYQGGSRPGQKRSVKPTGIVRNLNGDYLVAVEDGQSVAKRYLLSKITSC